MKFTDYDIALAHALTKKFSALFAERDATNHPLEKVKVEEEIAGMIIQGNDNSIVNLAHEILDAKIDAETAAYVEAASRFYNSLDRAMAAARSCDLIAKLNHDRRELSRSPSVELAAELRSIFDSFAAANPLPAAEDPADDLTEGAAAPPAENARDAERPETLPPQETDGAPAPASAQT